MFKIEGFHIPKGFLISINWGSHIKLFVSFISNTNWMRNKFNKFIFVQLRTFSSLANSSISQVQEQCSIQNQNTCKTKKKRHLSGKHPFCSHPLKDIKFNFTKHCHVLHINLSQNWSPNIKNGTESLRKNHKVREGWGVN